MSKFPIIIRYLGKSRDGYCIRFERLEDYATHVVDGKTYFSNMKYVADKSYIGEVFSDLREQICDEKVHIIEGDDYDIEVTDFTIVFRHEKVIPK